MSIRSRLKGLIYNKHVQSGAFDCDIRVDLSFLARNLDAAEYWLANEILTNSNNMVPFKTGALRQSGHVIDTDTGYRVEWSSPYAHYLHEGEVYINPKHNASGWVDQYGQWHGWKGQKVPSGQQIVYHTEGTQDHWVKAAQEAYMDHWIRGARRVAGGRNGG